MSGRLTRNSRGGRGDARWFTLRRDMPRITLAIAAALIAVPVIFWLATGTSSYTPLIPAVFGVLLGVCGLIALTGDAARKHAMHAAMAIALLSLLALVGEAVGRPGALQAPLTAQLLKVICGGLLLAYLILGIRSFRAARLARTSGSTAAL